MKKILMTLALLCTLGQRAWAEDVEYIHYTGNLYLHSYTSNRTIRTERNPTVLTSELISGNTEDRLYDGWYVLNSSFTYDERIVIYGDVHLILKDGCTLTAKQGIRINTDATLSIYAQSEVEGTMGKLVAIETHHDKAAIGGNKNYRAGRLFIHGGEIEATCNSGSKYAAGIGGGYGDGSGMEEITIYGGKVTAKGAKYGAGIGGGKNNNNPGTINIFGGTVNAEGGEKSAGIGGGENRPGWDTNICGGDVTAQGGHYGAGIGGSFKSDGGNLHFYDGTVNATGGLGASGIGGGNGGNGGNTTIDGGTVTAHGKGWAAGIGGGGDGSAGVITINGGTVTADADSYFTTQYIGSDGDEEIDEIYIPAMIGYGAESTRRGTVTIGNGATVHLSTTNELSDKNAPAVGCNSLTLGSNLRVTAKPYDGESVTVSSVQRVNTCMMKSRTLDIVPCTEHELDYTVTAEGHTAHCKYCEYSSSEMHSIVAPSTTCEKCGYGSEVTVCTLSFPQTSTAEVSGYATAGFLAVQGKTIAMPACTAAPDGWKFVGWLKQSNLPTSIEAADSETSLLQPGDEYTVIGDERFFARYRYDFTETWTWDENLTSASLTIKAGSGEDISLTPTVSDRTETAATDAANGRISATATATYTHGSTTYTFSNTQTKVLSSSLSLGEDDNTAALTANDGRSMNVTLTGRTLYKDDKWNTLCLPFDVEDISGSPLAGATLKEFTDAAYNAETGTLTLTFTDATSIKAGQAYLIKWGSGTDLGPSDLVFTGVTLAKDLRDDEISTDDSGTATVTFMGTYKKLTFNADDKSILFLGAGNTLFYPQNGATIGAQRAYFQLSGITAGNLAAASSDAKVRAFVLDFGDEEEATGINNLTVNSQLSTLNSDAWYDLSGRRLSGKPTQCGLYICNGKKVVIK